MSDRYYSNIDRQVVYRIDDDYNGYFINRGKVEWVHDQDVLRIPFDTTHYDDITQEEAKEILVGWGKIKALNVFDNEMTKNEFYCPVYEDMVSKYDCDEISYGAETGRYVNDGLPFLMPIETVLSRKEICLKCEHNGSNKPSSKQLIAAVEGKNLNEDAIHDLALLIQQAVKENELKK